MLTRRMLDLYNFLVDYKAKNDIAPSVQEMSDFLDLNSKSGVHRLLVALEERGAITRIKGRARAIRFVEGFKP